MRPLNVLYRDVDRTPYLFMLRQCARQYDLDIRLDRVDPRVPKSGASGEEWGELLAREEVDVIAENYWGLQTYRARGTPFVTVGSAVHYWTEKLLVRPGITTLDDLRGKRFAVRSSGPQRVFPALFLADHGLSADVELVLVEQNQTGRWGHWKAVAHGMCDACFMTPLYERPAIQAGLVERDYRRYAFEGGNVILTTTEGLAQRKHGEIQALVNAAFDVSEMFRADLAEVLDAVGDECAVLLAEHFDLREDPVETLFEVIRDELDPTPVPTAEGIHNAHRIRFDTNPELREFNPLLMWDLSFAKAAQSHRDHSDLQESPGRQAAPSRNADE